MLLAAPGNMATPAKAATPTSARVASAYLARVPHALFARLRSTSGENSSSSGRVSAEPIMVAGC